MAMITARRSCLLHVAARRVHDPRCEDQEHGGAAEKWQERHARESCGAGRCTSARTSRDGCRAHPARMPAGVVPQRTNVVELDTRTAMLEQARDALRHAARLAVSGFVR